MSHHRILVDRLRFAYPNGRPVLSGVSFDIHHGESVAIVGANGAGKTTLLKQMNGLLLPDGGQVVVGDLPVTAKTLVQVRRKVGTVFQDPDDQLFMPTVFDDVAFGPLNQGIPEKACRALAETCLEQVGAWHLRERAPHTLSGGEKRRAAIAAVLAMSPDILLLDEPTTGLDPQGRRQIIELLRGFAHSKLVVSHDLDMVLDLCPRAIVLSEGKVAADGSTENLLQDAGLLEQAGLEVPERLKACPACGHVRAKNSSPPAGIAGSR